MASRRPLVPEGIDTIGTWYQPYLHSSSRTFNIAQKAHYQNFTLANEVKNAKEIATKIFKNLKIFYTRREKEIAKALGIKYDDMKKFKDDFFDNMKKDLTGDSANFPNLFNVGKTLKQLNHEQDEDYKKFKQRANTRMNDIWNKGLKKATNYGDFTKAEKSAAQNRKEDALYITYATTLDLTKILENKGIKAPQSAIDELALSIVTGAKVTSKAAKELQKALTEELQEVKKFRGSAPGQVQPVVQTKSSKNYGTVKISNNGRIGSQINNPLGNMDEDVIAYQLNRKTAQGYSNTFNHLITTAEKNNKNITVTAIVVGNKQKRKTTNVSETEVFIDDVVIKVTNTETYETITIGIDAKRYNQESGKGYKYGRGGIVKRPSELVPNVIPLEKFETYVYLTANSYFYNRAIFDQLLSEPQSGVKTPELYQVINWLRGIYGLLPAAPVDFSDIDFAKNSQNVLNIVRQDTRTFVRLNDKLMWMTDFLREIEDQALNKDKVRNTVTLLSKNFTNILKNINTSFKLRTDLKQKKKNELRWLDAPAYWLQTEQESRFYYAKLYERYIYPIFEPRQLEKEWKYFIRTEFTIR